MKNCDGHAKAYSNDFSAVNFLSFNNPVGALKFCAYLLKTFDHNTIMIIMFFTNIHQKFYKRRMNDIYKV